jgi:hypothetical protein
MRASQRERERERETQGIVHPRLKNDAGERERERLVSLFDGGVHHMAFDLASWLE